MAGLTFRNFDKPDETRPFPDGKGRLDVFNTGGGAVGRAVFEPGWRWSEHIKPLAGTESCQSAHTGYVVSGRMKIVMDDGESGEIGPGDFIEIAPGHDAYVLGDEPCVALDWTGYGDYAKPVSG
ncbi:MULTISPECIES: cupin domain-containing protein [unclassified Streptomyces]|uniref:cupin domain-containing protein n=1 Tax=unclassified Streptomyces TaxID=2593676 RepID=UPI00214B0A80|nr:MULTISPECIES: cupin domain-containing protein [unclassified Streptomyces]MCX5012137.1 cupin domain-containing protein [Streptomyces sp. NBC_00555]MCX5606097.1 cupin domain-containing protein [Streptomyces sp. NBC_00047]UUU40355.1 cupin domain-containing protein [Streptomyces sp. NBC_00162]